MNSTPKYNIGELVFSSSRQRQGKILDIQELGGKTYYRVDLGKGIPVVLSESDLGSVTNPLERLAKGDYGYASDFDLVVNATALSFAYQYEGLACLSNSRLDPKPYQIFVAHRALSDLHPRYLLADEVGLGKTIEAGLILKELKARGLAERVLIIVPASLREQWQGEMEIKFNEWFYIYDGTTIRENQRRYPGKNPWGRDKNIITSLQYARQQTSQANQPTGTKGGFEMEENIWIDEIDWDLVIFDEAHHLRRYLKGKTINSGREITKSYRLGQILAEKTNSLLLLTATPLQLSQYDTYSLIELLDSTLYPSYSDFLKSTKLTGTLVSVDKILRKIDSENITDNDQVTNLIIEAFILLLYSLLESNDKEEFWDELIESCIDELPSHQREDAIHKVKELRESINESLFFYKLWLHYGAEINESLVGDLHKFISVALEYPKLFEVWATRQHKLSQIMMRNRKREVLKGEFVRRLAHSIKVEPTQEEFELYNLVSDYIKTSYAHVTGHTMALGFVLTTFRKLLVSSPFALAASLERRADRIENALKSSQTPTSRIDKDDLEEMAEILESIDQIDDLLALTGWKSTEEIKSEIGTLRNLASMAREIKFDSKAIKLINAVNLLLESDHTTKTLIFTQFRETQSYLQKEFEKQGYQTALFHGEQGSSSYGKRKEFERFKKNPDVRIMISTEVGGEGLNFQFCNHLFNYDLPWNPMRIEQRIGRLDRIGQNNDVHIYNFHLEGTLDARILSVLQDRIRLFESTIGNLDPILGEDIEGDIEEIIMASEDEVEQKFTEFEDQIVRRISEAREAEEKIADFIMDANSFRRDTVDEILGRKSALDNTSIESFTITFLNRYPQEEKLIKEDNFIYKINVPERFREDCKKLYGIHLLQYYRGTFDPKVAIEEDTIDFFAFGHPLFDAIIKYCKDIEHNNHFNSQAVFRNIEANDHKGYKGVQFNYVLSLNGVRTYGKMIPIVLDIDGKFDQDISDLIFSLPSNEHSSADRISPIPYSSLQSLEKKSQESLNIIVEKELALANERNSKDFKEIHEKTSRLFEYRLQNQHSELERRNERLEDAKQKQQSRILPAIEGQVQATKRRILELEQQKDKHLEELTDKSELSLSIDLLNIAQVTICK